jgi:2-methylaconitate cis-trans-isomerase PrpF
MLDVPAVGEFAAARYSVTMINAGIPPIFLKAADLGYKGTELQDDINNDEKALARFETIRAYGALKMGLIDNIEQAAERQHTPKVAFVGASKAYVSSSGKHVKADDIDLNVRALSMGKLHHAMMGTAAVAIGTAAAIPGTLVAQAIAAGSTQSVSFGHPSGTLKVGAETKEVNGEWTVNKVSMSRSERVLMEGWVSIPGDSF